MNKTREAAVNLRKIWQAHDEKNQDEGRKAAAELYRILGGKVEHLDYAGFLTIQAYFLSDRAEEYQKKNDPTAEDFFYNEAMQNLIKAREAIGFETDSPKYTIKWWKAYRHNDKEGLRLGLLEEHRIQFPHLPPDKKDEYAKLCMLKLIDVARGHDVKDWALTDDLLNEYFKVYFVALGNS